MIIAVIVLGVLVVILLALVLRQQLGSGRADQALLLKQDLTKLSDDILKLKDGLQFQLSDRLDKNQSMMLKSLADSKRTIAEVTRELTEVKAGQKQVLSITDELKGLQNVLQNPKQRGVLGEIYLAQLLNNVLAPDQFGLQHKFKDGQTVDAVIKLDKNRLLPIDSKFSLENYNRLVEEKDKLRRAGLAKLFREDLKKRIDETSKYIRPSEGTLDYAFMFIPSEAIYYDLLINKVGLTQSTGRDLIEYAFRDKHVIIVGPTTFMAYLQTVLQGLRSLQIEEQAKEIQQRVGELGRHILSFETFMQKLGAALGITVSHYNSAHKELKKVDKDVVKIADSNPAVEPLILDRPSDLPD